MVTVPGFLLRRLYVKGSLTNTREGFQFQLLNRLGSGYARRMLPLTVDGREIPQDRCSFSLDGSIFFFEQVSNELPFTLDLNKTTTISVEGEPLEGGAHTIGLGFEVAGLGVLQFDFTDVLSGE
jgi:hypothetical protein